MATTTKAATSKTLTVASMPPSIEAMRIALVYVVTNHIDAGVKLLQLNSTDMLRRWATLSRDLSDRGACFFCGTARAKATAKSKKTWEGYQLCNCLSAYKIGYEELYPWKNLQALIKAVESGKLDESTPAYADNCAEANCAKGNPRFTVRVGNVVFSALKDRNRAYRQTHRCEDCRKRVKLQRQAAAAKPLTHNIVVKAKGKNKKPQGNSFADITAKALTPNEIPQG